MDKTPEDTDVSSTEQDPLQAAQSAGAIHINTADGDSQPLQLQSMCMRCHETVGVMSCPFGQNLLLFCWMMHSKNRFLFGISGALHLHSIPLACIDELPEALHT